MLPLENRPRPRSLRPSGRFAGRGVGTAPSVRASCITPSSGRRSQSSGFSLVEILVALLILSLTLLAVAPLFIYASKETAVAGDLGSVGAIAVHRMELIKQTAFASLTAGGSLTSNQSGFFDTSNTGYTVRWTVSDDASPATLKTIQVRVVAARAPVGLPKEITLTGLEAQ